MITSKACIALREGAVAPCGRSATYHVRMDVEGTEGTEDRTGWLCGQDADHLRQWGSFRDLHLITPDCIRGVCALVTV